MDHDQVSWKNFRMPTWEEDISLNHHSVEPFENLPAPNQMPREAFNIVSQLTEELLEGVALDQYIANDTYPIPSPQDREGYNANFNASFFLNGLADYLKIHAAVKRHGIAMRSYFDFGCASGRVLRHFCAQSQLQELWGSDINGRHIRWLNEHLPSNLKIIHNHCLPNLQMADCSVDVISAFSVFTHIDIFETAWLAELYRILKPGGMVYLTVQNDDSWRVIQNADASDAILQRLHKFSDQTPELLLEDLPHGRTDFRYTNVGPYRALVYHSNSYLYQTWGRFFEIAEIMPLAHGKYQSVLIGIKH